MTHAHGIASMEPDDLKLAWQTLSRRLERLFVGIDCEAEYCAMARRRLSTTSATRPLFAK